jgi:hypothetical protein
MRTDNAAEYETLSKEAANEGILFEFTEPHTPQQNGFSERRNRTIFSIVRGLLRDGALQRRFWTSAAQTAA